MLSSTLSTLALNLPTSTPSQLVTYAAIAGATTGITLVASTLYNRAKLNQARTEIKQKDQSYRNLLEKAPVSILIHRDDKIIYANQTCLKNLRFKNKEDIIGKPIWDLIDHSSKQLVSQRINKLREKADSHLVDHIRLSRSDGSPIDVEVMSNRTEHHGSNSIQVAFVDITNRINSERTLLQNKQRLDLALLGGSLSIWDLDTSSDRAVVNDYFYEMTGFRKDNFELSRKNWNTLIHPDDLAQKELQWNQLLSGFTKYYESEYRIKIQNEKWIWIQDSGNIVSHNEQGKPKRIVGTYREITKRKTAEAELIKERNLAKKANQAKDEFLSMMSHEMRTPLNPIIGFSNILLNKSKDPSTQSYLKTINDAGLHLNTLIKDILDFSTIETGRENLELETFDLRELCRSVVSFCLPEINKKGLLFKSKILVDIDRSESLVQGDSTKVKQILTNLLSNACKYTEKGSISLSCTMSFTSDGKSEFQFNVKDSGIGIRNAEIEPIFEPFRQSDSSYTRRYEGIGLGLAICKRYAKLMGGSIKVQSKLGSGSLFTLTLPLRRTQTSMEGISNKNPIVHWATNSKILVVEDNEANKDFIIAAIRRVGCTPDFATNGQEALSAIEQTNYDLVFMDVRMPILDGIQATLKLRSQKQSRQALPPIIALTAHVSKEDKKRCYDAGMDDCLTKPFQLEELEHTLRKWLPTTTPKSTNHTA